jgi:mannose-6-phosphate isomerase-like protein (cupin superfamily)
MTYFDHLLGPQAGETVQLRALGVRFMLDSAITGGGFSLVEHPLPARSLGAPLHTHSREDEYSFVLEGRIGLQLGSEVVEAGPGNLVLKPRNVPHAFWNAGAEPARLLEIISPGGFEDYFREMAAVLRAAPEPDLTKAAAICERYGIEMHFESIPVLVAQYGLIGSR